MSESPSRAPGSAPATRENRSQPPTTTASSSSSSRDPMAALDTVIAYGAVLLAISMALLIPVGYISREAGAGVVETFLHVSLDGVRYAQHGALGRTWPLSVAFDVIADSYLAPKLNRTRRSKLAAKASIPDNEPVDQVSGRPLRHLLAEDDALLMEYANDDSYTRFEDTAIFFRPLLRKVPVSAASGKPELRFLYQLTEGNRSRLREVKEKLHKERQRARNLRAQGETSAERKGEITVQSYGMAEIDPETNTLQVGPAESTLASPVSIPCVHPVNEIYADRIISLIQHAYVITNSYVEHPEAPFDAPSENFDIARPCLLRILPMMCVGDKWEIICPRNMTHTEEKLGRRSMSIRFDIRDLEGPTRTLSDAKEALAQGVFMPQPQTHEHGQEQPRVFTREMLLERAKRRGPRILF